MDNPRIGFIGAGTLGKGLALALAAKNYQVVAVSSRTHSSAEDLAARIPGSVALPEPQQLVDGCHLVFITTPDGAINQVASQVRWQPGQAVVHCSGAQPLDVLESAARLGAITGSFHPFQTFACLETPEEAIERLSGTTFAVEGNSWLLAFLESIADQLGGKAIRLRPEDRAIYHASGLMVCGYLVALLKAAAEMWRPMGVRQEEALSLILPLAKTTLTNLSRSGVNGSVTGPVVRGDDATVRKHLDTLSKEMPGLIPLYCSLSKESLSLAGEDVSVEKLKEIDQMIDEWLHRYISSANG